MQGPVGLGYSLPLNLTKKQKYFQWTTTTPTKLIFKKIRASQELSLVLVYVVLSWFQIEENCSYNILLALYQTLLACTLLISNKVIKCPKAITNHFQSDIGGIWRTNFGSAGLKWILGFSIPLVPEYWNANWQLAMKWNSRHFGIWIRFAETLATGGTMNQWTWIRSLCQYETRLD